MSTAYAISLTGLRGVPVRVEAQLGTGLVQTTIVGLADTALRESKERLRSALQSCQVPSLNRRLTINLSPASLPKTGSGFDLSIAAAVLSVRGLVDPELLPGTVFAAELGLDGTVRPIPGILAHAWSAQDQGFRRIVVAEESRAEADQVQGIEVIGCRHLSQLVQAFQPGGAGWDQFCPPPAVAADPVPGALADEDVDLNEVRGQPAARWAALVAAVGGHHLLLHGEAGSGKTLLAERIGTLLPPLASHDALVLGAMRSATSSGGTLDRRAPNQIAGPNTTVPALLGGGPRLVRPGLISLAHGGVLVLNEAPEFPRRVLDALRGPLDNGEVTIRRTGGVVTFPAQFQLVLTANPCGCGPRCHCTPSQRHRYRQRLSGLLLDRIDIQWEMNQPTLTELERDQPISSAEAQQQVAAARARGRDRWSTWPLNAHVPGRFLRTEGSIPDSFLRVLELTVSRGNLSLRGADRILRLAWSIADLAGHHRPTAEDLSSAMTLRLEHPWGRS